MKFIIPIIFLLVLLIPLIYAETTFFDNPDDAFTMDVSATGGVVETPGGTSGGCRYIWNCTNWSICLESGKQTRNCTNTGTCSATYNPPKIEQNCTYTIFPKTEEEPEITWKEIVNKNKASLYPAIVLIFIFLVILLVIFYSRKNYFKKHKKR